MVNSSQQKRYPEVKTSEFTFITSDVAKSYVLTQQRATKELILKQYHFQQYCGKIVYIVAWRHLAIVETARTICFTLLQFIEILPHFYTKNFFCDGGLHPDGLLIIWRLWWFAGGPLELDPEMWYLLWIHGTFQSPEMWSHILRNVSWRQILLFLLIIVLRVWYLYIRSGTYFYFWKNSMFSSFHTTLHYK